MQRVEAGVVAEGAFGAQLAQLDVAFENDLGVGGHFEIDGFAFDDFDGLAAQEAGDEEFFDLGRRGDDGGECGGGIGADGDGDFQPRVFALPRDLLAVRMGPSGTVTAPPADSAMRATRAEAALRSGRGAAFARRTGAGARDNVRRRLSGAASACRWSGRRRPACGTCRCCACLRVARVDAGQGDEAAAVVGPAFEDGKDRGRSFRAG